MQVMQMVDQPPLFNTDPLSNTDSEPSAELEQLLRSLRRKEGNWVSWGQACQQLQKAGYSPQTIFEETGFEPIHQNQVIVASQVYASITSGGLSETATTHFQQRGSDVLYELRILNQAERIALAELAVAKQIDADEVHSLAKALKEFSRLGSLPEGFGTHPGDAIAYQCYKLARQQADLQERSRLIAKGLRYAHSETARKRVEQLLTDFTVVAASEPPRLPVYRLDDAEQMPRVLPVVGKLPLTKADLQAVPLVEEVAPFNLVTFSGAGAWVAIPGWQVILSATDPVVLLVKSDQFPTPLPGKTQEVLLVVDRAQRDWQGDRFFLVEQAGELTIQWFEQPPLEPLLGQVILVLRPKQVLDEDYTKELWQIDE